MTKQLVACLLAVGLGCASGGSAPRPDATTTAPPDATIARADAAPTGMGGSGGAPAAAPVDAASIVKPADAAPAAAGGVDWMNCGQASFKEGVSATDFCAEYMTACGFDASGGGSGTERYKSLADCMTAYAALSDGPRGGKACVAWQLCIASHPNNAATFCPRAPEASLMSGPCKPSYL